ncbi:hypothetical protein RFI_36023, partial [Reticulomyxa filosa]
GICPPYCKTQEKQIRKYNIKIIPANVQNSTLSKQNNMISLYIQRKPNKRRRHVDSDDESINGNVPPLEKINTNIKDQNLILYNNNGKCSDEKHDQTEKKKK